MTTGPDGLPVAFHDFAPEKFPFVIEIWDDDKGVVWEATIAGPGALAIPALGPEGAERRYVKIVFADGEIVTSRGAP